jgi:hypothetical protein
MTSWSGAKNIEEMCFSFDVTRMQDTGGRP